MMYHQRQCLKWMLNIRISKLDTNKPVGVDGISTKFIQTSPHCMHGFVSYKAY